MNQVRRLLAEHGIAIPRDIARLRSGLAKIVENDAAGLGVLMLEPGGRRRVIRSFQK